MFKEEKKEESHEQKLAETIKQKDQQIKELTDTLQRLQAEFENYTKRVEKENAEFRRYSEVELIKKLLPVLDSFELALRNNQEKEKFVKGVEMIYAQLFQTLEEEGLRKIEALGKKFDHFYHEVLMTENNKEKEDELIVEELQKGYMLNDKILRYSKVKINKKEEEKKWE